MTADAATIMRRTDQESKFNLEMQGITRSHDKGAVSVDPQGDLELLGTSGNKHMDGLSITKKEKAAEEDSDASPSCHPKKTDYSDGGFNGGVTYYLDRHTVDCGRDLVMRQWNLQRSGNNVRINYECCEVPHGVERIHTKKKTPSHSGSEVSLERLVNLGAVDCGTNLLQKWKVVRDPLKIEYWCAKSKFPIYLSSYSQIDGPGKDDGPGQGKLMYLDRHNVECPAGRYLSKWDIERIDGNAGAHIKMVYGCWTFTEPEWW